RGLDYRALLAPVAAGAHEEPCPPDVAAVGRRADQGGISVGGERDAIAESVGARPDCLSQLRLLRPAAARVRKKPSGPSSPPSTGIDGVLGPSDEGRGPVGGKGNAVPEPRVAECQGACELGALLAPDPSRPGVPPGGALAARVERRADQRGAPVGRKGDA